MSERDPLLGRAVSRRHPSTAPPTAAASSLKATESESESVDKQEGDGSMEFKDLSRKSQWIALAVMSGACAAFNGVFAKL